MMTIRTGLCRLALSLSLSLFATCLAASAGAAVPDPAESPAPVPLADAARRMTLPEGFSATLFAGEPDVRQPIALTIDDRGRLWVVECYSYPAWLSPGTTRKDRILIFEDADHDGRFDKRTVFWDQGTNLTGIEVGFGGVWVCATPNLLFLPDRDGDDVPDSAPVVVLDGWDTKAQHNMFNALTWGPDGWLWGCNGIMSNSKVGRPGTPEADRVTLNCGVWRYHPTRQAFEVVAHGTTNPWGLDFDDHGEAFITNCVIPHLYHVVPGAHFERMYGQDINPHSYALLGSAADHIHWAGGRWQDSRGGRGKHGEAGGGHAHSGALIYLGDSWPDRYRNTVLTCNLHGNRLNNDRLARRGSGYVASHDPDFLLANDTWFRGITLKQAPDGSVFVLDWSDTDECHDTDSHGPERQTGRIYKIAYGSPKSGRIDLARAPAEELARLQASENEWQVRTARRLLQERAAAGQDLSKAQAALRSILDSDHDARHRLRALWALHTTGGLDRKALLGLLKHESEDVRGWAVRLLTWDATAPLTPEDVAPLARMARTDRSPRVRLQLASALQRIPARLRFEVADGLVRHEEDARDANLPLMVWYGVEPIVAPDRAEAAKLADASALPIVRQHLARRIVEVSDPAPPGSATVALDELLTRLGKADDPAWRRDVLRGMHEALRGRKAARMPAGWPDVARTLVRNDDPAIREQAEAISLIYNLPEAADALLKLAADRSAATERRAQALQALIERRVPGLARTLLGLLDDPDIRGVALRGLAAYDEPEAPRAILNHYGSLTDPEKDDAIATLAARPAWALAMLQAVQAGTIPRRDLSAATARQLLAFGDPNIKSALEQAWGTIRPASQEKAAQMARLKALLGPDRLRDADPSRGRTVFNRSCAQCHKMYDTGGAIGPDLTGSDRANLDYVLENVLDPSAAVGSDYRLTTLATADGRLLSGMIKEQSETSVTVQTANERLILPREDIEEMKPSTASMMPEGLFDKLSDQDIRDLVAYLATKAQVPPAPEVAR